MRFANLALISGCHHNKKAEDVLFRFVFYYAILSNDFFGQPFTDYLFLCKKSGIFKDLVATLERKSAGGF